MNPESQLPSAPTGAVESSHKPVVKKGRPPIRRPDLDTVFSINPDGSRNAIHPADVHGRFQRRKNVLWLVLIGIYVAMPWVKIGGKPAILIDIAARHFFLFGRTFNAQDFWLAFFYLSGLGFTLIVVAALFGRLWCGYACPQTVFLEGVFRRIERWLEGNSQARSKLDRERMSRKKVLLRGAKLAIYAVVSLVLSHSFLGYFMPVEHVLEAITSPPGEHFTAFLFTAIFTGIIFVNFTWFREQLCIVVCPYGRLQGVLYDPDTLLVGYDSQRGEPRGPAGSAGSGDCVDCYRCVSVCPTGIDIRNGVQLECVGCANCIDACDEVMTKLGKPKGLVRYDSQRGFDTGARRFFRPRLLLYAALLAIGATVFLFAVSHRRAFEANLVRTLGSPFTISEGVVRNNFTLHLINKLPETHSFHIEAIGPQGAEIVITQPTVELKNLEDMEIVVLAQIAEARFEPGQFVELRVSTVDAEGETVALTAKARFAGPDR